MPIERLSALGQDGNSYTVIRKTPHFPALSRNSTRFDMATYRLDSGEELSPTGGRNAFRTADAGVVVTLVPLA